ncbi:unnamed protein product [Amoebophrya sp. A120]|nr:unnamed protein product [Amoebophrya sp. A120]|eukprot:GSA120T00007023001.1
MRPPPKRITTGCSSTPPVLFSTSVQPWNKSENRGRPRVVMLLPVGAKKTSTSRGRFCFSSAVSSLGINTRSSGGTDVASARSSRGTRKTGSWCTTTQQEIFRRPAGNIAAFEHDQVGAGAVLPYTSYSHPGAVKNSNNDQRGRWTRFLSSTTISISSTAPGRSVHGAKNELRTIEKGTPGTPDYRVFFATSSKGCCSQLPAEVAAAPSSTTYISPWHDIPLRPILAQRVTEDSAYNSSKEDENTPDLFFHFVCEVPMFTTAKFETSKTEDFNPIKQDTRKKSDGPDVHLRHYQYESEGEKGMFVGDYGFFPQTFSSREERDSVTDVPGDDDPLDVLVISTTDHDDLQLGNYAKTNGEKMTSPAEQTQVVRKSDNSSCTSFKTSTTTKVGECFLVKLLGGLALIDEGETDWKMLCVRIEEDGTHNDFIPDAPQLDRIRKWFRFYKTAEGKPVNDFFENGRFFSAEECLPVIEAAHSCWKRKFCDKSRIHFRDSQELHRAAIK